MRPAVDHDDVTESGVYVRGNELRYLRAGDEGDPPVLLLHGGVVDAAHLTWGAAIGPLARDHEVYALDLLGYGQSDKPPGPYPTGRHVEVVADFLDVVGIESPDVVGCSVGGGVAIQLALERPELLERIVPVGSFGLGTTLPNGRLSYLRSRLGVLNRLNFWLAARREGWLRQGLDALVSDADALSDDLVDAIQDELRRPGAGRAFRSWRTQEVGYGGWNTYYYTRLDDLSVPALFVHGGQDQLFPARWAERAAGEVPEGEVEVFEDAGHWLPRDRPDRFNELVVSYLAD